MAKLHYLTVQDILWINLQATKKVQHFSYARLEEATFYQYAYGDSNELLSQAGRFLAGFTKMRPLDAGVEATAFLALATFLRINGARLRLEDGTGAAWSRAAAASTEAAREALGAVVEIEPHGGHHDGKPDVRAAVRAVMENYPCTLEDLAVAGAVV